MASQPPPSALLSTPPDGDASFEDLRHRLEVRSRVLELSSALGQAVSAELKLEPLCDLVVVRVRSVFGADALRLDFLENFAAILDVYYAHDENQAKLCRSFDGVTCAPEDVATRESEFVRTFIKPDQLGFNLTLQARF